MNVGQRIKARRKQLGMSAEELAAKINKSPATVYRYEKGEINKVDSSSLLPIADALNTTPGYLMGWEDVESSFVLSPLERRLVLAFRDAEQTAQNYALDMLESHPAMEKENYA